MMGLRVGRSALLLLSAVAAGALYGCDQFCFGSFCLGGSALPGPDQPGSYSYYAQMTFASHAPMCVPLTTNCYFMVNANIGQTLNGFGWTGNSQITDGKPDGINWGSAITTEAQVVNDQSNLVYLYTHGWVDGTGHAYMCLRDCNGLNYGNSNSVSTADMPGAWRGPTWLVVDSCSSVTLQAGWENRFGGNLHGVLGFHGPGPGLGPAAMQQFVNLIAGYDTAIDAWEKATAASQFTSSQTSLFIPVANSVSCPLYKGGTMDSEFSCFELCSRVAIPWDDNAVN